MIPITLVFLSEMEERKDVTSYEEKSLLSSLKKSLWLNIVLFILTIFSAISVGFTWGINYKYAEALAKNPQLPIGLEMLADPQIVSLGIIYAAVLMVILLGHDFGHFLTCRFYRINATLPYFIPAPGLIGTLGAFIKIKSKITIKHQLFDIGVAGPLTGFILSLPALVYGLSVSKPAPALPSKE